MKKTLIGLFLILGAVSFADAGKIEAKSGIDLGGKYRYGKDFKNYNSYPVYGTAKYTFDTQTAVKPYIKGDLGYSINKGNHDYGRSEKYKAKNGAYYGVGGGINFDNVNVELMFKENKGKYEYEGPLGVKSKYNTNYKRVSLGVGYDFELGN